MVASYVAGFDNLSLVCRYCVFTKLFSIGVCSRHFSALPTGHEQGAEAKAKAAPTTNL